MKLTKLYCWVSIERAYKNLKSGKRISMKHFLTARKLENDWKVFALNRSIILQKIIKDTKYNKTEQPIIEHRLEI